MEPLFLNETLLRDTTMLHVHKETDKQPQVAVLIPCHNEELTIGKVVDDCRRELPSATVYVFDNCSTDATAEIAQLHGAVVVKECRKGKGFVVESMFGRITAD